MFLINHNITGCFQFVAIKSQRTALNAMEIQKFFSWIDKGGNISMDTFK